MNERGFWGQGRCRFREFLVEDEWCDLTDLTDADPIVALITIQDERTSAGPNRRRDGSFGYCNEGTRSKEDPTHYQEVLAGWQLRGLGCTGVDHHRVAAGGGDGAGGRHHQYGKCSRSLPTVLPCIALFPLVISHTFDISRRSLAATVRLFRLFLLAPPHHITRAQKHSRRFTALVVVCVYSAHINNIPQLRKVVKAWA